jgi:hypothetical protein
MRRSVAGAPRSFVLAALRALHLHAGASPAASAINQEQDYIHHINRMAIDRGSQHR